MDGGRALITVVSSGCRQLVDHDVSGLSVSKHRLGRSGCRLISIVIVRSAITYSIASPSFRSVLGLERRRERTISSLDQRRKRMVLDR